VTPTDLFRRRTSPLTQLKLTIHHELIKEMDLKKDLMNTKNDPAKQKELESKTQRVITQLTDRLGQGLSRDERTRVIKEVLDESLGLGPLEELLADPAVTEIMVNGADMIYVEKSGKLTLSPITFTSNQQLKNVIERIVTPLGRRIDEKTPYVDARLEDGSRVNAIIEPLSIDGPAVTIRKFSRDRITPNDYVNRFHSMTQSMVDFLKICVEQGLNVIISGGTGSGKTTLLNVMSGFIPANERIITVEDAAELQMKQEHVVRLETRPANMEGSGEITIRDLIRNSLRMRPDRIVVGECRDGAALDMLSAMNTGHDGSMTTVHSNNPREAISRLETLCMMAGMDLPVRAIREQIAGAVDLIVQISRLSDGSRKIMSITEVVGMQGDTVTLQEIFRFKEEGFDKNRKIVGSFQAMGMIPTFIEKFEQRGVIIPRNLFTSASSTPPAARPKPGSRPMTPSRLRSPLRSTTQVTPSAGTQTLKKVSSGEGNE
ncbi:MAG: CpaF family protein, partial [Bdellovibrionales bacterium]|nr:CpaF family protein [Bdellovibrionales bacterium]